MSYQGKDIGENNGVGYPIREIDRINSIVSIFIFQGFCFLEGSESFWEMRSTGSSRPFKPGRTGFSTKKPRCIASDILWFDSHFKLNNYKLLKDPSEFIGRKLCKLCFCTERTFVHCSPDCYNSVNSLVGGKRRKRRRGGI